MMRFLAPISLLALACSLMGQGGQKTDSKTSNIAGNWTMTLELSMGTGTPTLVLKQDGEKLTGSYTGRYGTFALEGTVKERSIVFTFMMNAEGESVPMTFTGEISTDAQTMKGKATLGEMGDATWSAIRDKKGSQ